MFSYNERRDKHIAAGSMISISTLYGHYCSSVKHRYGVTKKPITYVDFCVYETPLRTGLIKIKGIPVLDNGE